MDTLVVVGTSTAFVYSAVVTAWPAVLSGSGIEPATYFDSSAMIIGLILLGTWLEARAKVRHDRRDPAAHRAAADDRSAAAWRRGRRRSPLEAVRPGDLLRVRPGDRVPVDGRLVAGGRRPWTSRC